MLPLPAGPPVTDRRFVTRAPADPYAFDPQAANLMFMLAPRATSGRP